MPTHPKTVLLNSFQGINNVSLPERTNPKYMKEANNVDLTKDGSFRLRKGFTQVLSGNYRSIWSNNSALYAMKGGDLVSISTAMDETVVHTGLDSELDVAYVKANNIVYFSNGEYSGAIENGAGRQWGINPPAMSPTTAVTSGILDEGRYQVVVTYSDADGRESGARLAASISVNANQGILLTGLLPSINNEVTTTNIYCTQANGEVFYLVASIPDTDTTFAINDVSHAVVTLKTQHMSAPPAATMLEYYNGRVYGAYENLLWWTEAMSYEHVSMSHNFVQYPSDIKGIMAVDDGIWVAADKLYYLAGKDGPDMRNIEKEDCVMVKGSGVKISGSYIFLENTPLGQKWLITTDRGIFVLMSSGVVLNLTEKNVAFPEAEQAAAAFIQQDGVNKYVSLLKNPNSDVQNVAVGDLAVGEIVRNGVVIS